MNVVFCVDVHTHNRVIEMACLPFCFMLDCAFSTPLRTLLEVGL